MPPARPLARLGERAVPVVCVAVAVGLAVAGPLRPHVDQVLPWLLAALVLTVALSSEVPRRGAAGDSARAAAVGAVLGFALLPAAAWLASLGVTGADRQGLVALGFAPAEIASVATVSLAGGSALVAQLALAGSVLLTVAVSGPGLRLLGGGAVTSGHLVASLALQVVAPAALGLLLGPRVRRRVGGDELDGSAVLLVAALAGLVASEVRLDRHLGVLVLLDGALVAAGYAVGVVAGLPFAPPARAALLLTCGMRDFAIGAGLATAAFGPWAAAPAAVFGVLVLLSGTASASVLRRRGRAPSPAQPAPPDGPPVTSATSRDRTR